MILKKRKGKLQNVLIGIKINKLKTIKLLIKRYKKVNEELKKILLVNLLVAIEIHRNSIKAKLIV